MIRLVRIVCMVACILSFAAVAGATEYQTHVLNTLQHMTYSSAYKINDHGVIVGSMATSYDTRSNAGVFCWDTAGVPHYAGFVSGSSIMGLNNSGTIIGGRYVYSSGSLTTLPKLTANYGSNSLADINDEGIVVGSSVYDYVTGVSHAVFWDGAGIHDLGTLDGHTASVAMGINDHRQVVGRSWNDLGFIPERAVVWENGSKTQLDPIDGYDFSAAYNINNSGEVVGTSSKWATYYGGGAEFSYLRQEAVLWQNGAAVDIAVDGMNTYATDINDIGLVVGYAYTYPYTGPSRAFVWQDGVLTWLDCIGAAGTEAYGINEAGWIVGRFRTSDGSYYPVAWEPVPEPSSIFVLLCGLGWLRALAKRRAR